MCSFVIIIGLVIVVQVYGYQESENLSLTQTTVKNNADNPHLFNEVYSSNWVKFGLSYKRYGPSVHDKYYNYDACRLVVPIHDNYSFTSDGIIDTYGYLYNNSFHPSSPDQNLLFADDDSGGNGQFRFTVSLVPNVTYILVVTTGMGHTYQQQHQTIRLLR
ncbi:unnamed protein product [Rotaria sordida]|uniref:Uncharacterized protein n=1 Tax=Rotaria sordida TaxID=392033 RepID=A0A815QZ51_9BILA|nr:unnamed protein product [Rotaria sordida]CAF1470268.1 unnamed protein product [Rotaria sordida]